MKRLQPRGSIHLELYWKDVTVVDFNSDLSYMHIWLVEFSSLHKAIYFLLLFKTLLFLQKQLRTH
jgi:hypothetical protein